MIYCKYNQLGRSMVEMLGVLAIIGVLSVGAIAGYSKAMHKHKLNQHAQATTFLINNFLQAKETLPKPAAGSTLYYGEILQKLNLLPDGIKYVSNSTLRDNYFNISMTPYHNRVNNQDFGGIGFNFGSKANNMADVCRNIIFAAKENSSNLWLLETGKSTSGSTTYSGHIYGDKYCDGKTKKCLNAVTLQETEKLCQVCEEGFSCNLYVLYK